MPLTCGINGVEAFFRFYRVPGGSSRLLFSGGLLSEPAFYGLFVVGGLASFGGRVEPATALFLAVGVMGIQCVGMLSSMIYRWTLERKWSLGCLKLASGVPRLGYFLGMLAVPVLQLLVRASVALATVWALCGFSLRAQLGPLAVGVALVGVFWASLGCALTALIRSYRVRDFVVSLALTPLMFSAPTLYSLDQAPAFLQTLSCANPLTWQLGYLRACAAGEERPELLAVAASMTLAMAVVGYLSTGRMRTVSNEG